MTTQYGKEADLAKNGKLEERRRLAASMTTKPEILYYMAKDGDPDVRKALAANTATPMQADSLLAKDADPEVRATLGQKISQMMPELTDKQKTKVRKWATDTLEDMSRDQALRVRHLLAETLKEMTSAPPAVIRQLARDTDAMVANPVIEFSPVLTDKDLATIIAEGANTARLKAVARRREVSEAVSDAIVETGDIEATAELLKNPGAHISEGTLDKIADRAEGHPELHEPLVARPGLSDKAAKRLAEYVADSLLDTLMARKDLSPELAEQVRAVVMARLAAGDGPPPEALAGDGGAGGGASGNGALEPEPDRLTRDEALELARDMNKKGQLTEGVIYDAIGRKDRNMAMAALAVLSDTKMAAVVKAFATNSAKGIVALVWEAGCSPKLAVDLQQGLGNVAPVEIIRPSSKAAYGLSEAEMSWQLEFLRDMA
ncbi:DUF2336 domain-containing protein [Thalassospiraceae bacterium LMO-SO8]|nr:DUF2336 domain-containing protein [Alphaproteobacteria bacterium LMO-S08]WND77270.1 DUF2336 domain-containing protein [Thalassospiraceae bacterium LMO-SO8]